MATVISEHYTAMCRHLNQLERALQKTPHRAAKVTTIPGVPRGREEEAVTTIVVSEHSGADAISSAARCYQDLHIHPNFSQKAARRTPGVLWFSPSLSRGTGEIVELVQRINEAKSSIEEHIVSNYDTRQARFEALRAECPGIMTLHLYRQIRCYTEGSVSSVRFFWQRKDVLVKPKKAELERRIREDLEHYSERHKLPLEQLLAKVVATPESQLRVRRPVKVQPAANLMLGRSVRTINAPMPIIVIQDAEVKIKLLGDFDASVHRKGRSDRRASEVLGTFGGNTIEAFSE
jgi:DNA replication terminus site-binding protein